MVYIIHLRGQVEASLEHVQCQSWVSSIKSSQSDDGSIWQVSVTDPEAAENHLLKLLVNDPVVVNRISAQAIRAGGCVHAG